MKKLMCLFVIWVLSSTAIQAQTWEKDYEFLGENLTIHLVCESKNGYVFGGNDDEKLYLFKVGKESGDTIWVQKNDFSEGYLGLQDMKEINDGKLLIIGVIRPINGGLARNLIIVTDSLGNVLKKKIWLQYEDNPGGLLKVIKNGDNTYTILQRLSKQFAIIKFNENLEIIWRKEHNDNGYKITDIIKTDQGYLATGGLFFETDRTIRPFMIKFDQSGNVVEKKVYTNLYFMPKGVAKINNGFLFFGYSDNKYSPAVFKTNEQGNFIWINESVLDNFETGRCINFWEIENKYIGITVENEHTDENCKTYIVSLDTSGNLINSHDLEKKHAILTINGSVLTSDKYVLLLGRDTYTWALKINPILVQIQNPVINDFCLKQNYPNPFNAETFIPFTVNKDSYVELIVYNSKGRKVENWSRYCSKGSYEIKFNSENLTSGIYFYKIKMENRTQTKKMLLMK